MTKAKEVETEIVGGAGATARLILKRKPNTKSGYYGVIPNGKGWRARVYKETKKSWDSIGTYTTAQEAAIAVAIAEKQVAAGNGSFYSPEKQRASTQEGASPASAISPSRARTLLHTLILTAPSPAHRGTFRSACDRAFPTSTPTPPTRAPCGRHLTAWGKRGASGVRVWRGKRPLDHAHIHSTPDHHAALLHSFPSCTLVIGVAVWQPLASSLSCRDARACLL